MTALRRPEAMLVMGDGARTQLFDDATLHRWRGAVTVGDPEWTVDLDTPAARARLAQVEVLVTSWGAPPLTADLLDRAPRLRAVLHAAGSVRPLVTPAVWSRGLRVTTAAEANAQPVAEFALAAVLWAGKRVPLMGQLARRDREDWSYRHRHGLLSNHRRTVGILGFSRVGRRLAALLAPFDVDVLVADPLVDPAHIRAAGAEPVDLDAMLPRCDVLSLHAPALPSTRHVLDNRRLALLPDGATVVNTARGVLIDTAALQAECLSGRLSAVLDVTDPEPLPASSPLYDLPNVLITPHVAGALDTETLRLSAAALDELDLYRAGLPALHPVDEGQMAWVA